MLPRMKKAVSTLGSINLVAMEKKIKRLQFYVYQTFGKHFVLLLIFFFFFVFLFFCFFFVFADNFFASGCYKKD